jgi:hypothetical protein
MLLHMQIHMNMYMRTYFAHVHVQVRELVIITFFGTVKRNMLSVKFRGITNEEKVFVVVAFLVEPLTSSELIVTVLGD